MNAINELGLFPLGKIVMTKGVHETVAADDLLTAVFRHSHGDWGDLCDADRRTNNDALLHQFRLFSRYRTSDGTKFWVITEHDRSYTTILLPNEY